MREVYWSKKYGNKYHETDCGCNACFKQSMRARQKGYITKYRKDISKGNDYFNYIKSPLWQERKDRYYLTHRKQCQACGASNRIDLHHMVYSSFGNEPDETLICLCRECHKDFHNKHKVSKYMMDSTLQYIRDKKGHLKEAKRCIGMI